jgi:hypothetical protein
MINGDRCHLRSAASDNKSYLLRLAGVFIGEAPLMRGCQHRFKRSQDFGGLERLFEERPP